MAMQVPTADSGIIMVPGVYGPPKGWFVIIDYTNWKGVRRERKIVPIRFEFMSTQHHPEKQWLMEAADLEELDSNGKPVDKYFAMKDIHSWRPM